MEARNDTQTEDASAATAGGTHGSFHNNGLSGRIVQQGSNNAARDHYNGPVTIVNGPQPSGPDVDQCLRDLRVTDPREDRARIEGDKDRLLRDCYTWILDDASFQRWRTQDESRLLWISGDPGKGKTMMTMGVIAELSRLESLDAIKRNSCRLDSSPEPLVSYFFCQNTLPVLNNAVSVLRGLVYMLVTHREDLLRHMQKRYKTAGRPMFEGHNAIYVLREVLSDMLNDPSLPPTYLIVDALDECTSGLPELLRIITDDNLGQPSRIKWLVTSRNVPEIERYLQPDSLGIRVSLEISESHVSKAVAAFVDYKMQRLATAPQYDSELHAEVQQQLRDKAEGTFLWVSIVCRELDGMPLYLMRDVLQVLPPGLHPLYKRMMSQIEAQDAMTVQYCRAILQTMTLAFRPLQLEELAVAAGLPSDRFFGAQAVLDLVGRCGSFLTVRDGVVSFVHLSAKDYITESNGRQVFYGTIAHKHGQMAERLLGAMDSMLRRDMCGLQKPGTRIHEVLAAECIENSPLPKVEYACEYWIEHLQAGTYDCNAVLAGGDWLYMFLWGHLLHLLVAIGLLAEALTCKDILAENGKVHNFLQKHLLHWLEAMSLLQKTPKAITALQTLEATVKLVESATVSNVVNDALRFAMWCGSGIQESPLQVYYGALVFAPEQSIVRQQFAQETPKGARVKCGLDKNWGALLQTLEGHSDGVRSVAFSHDSARLASASWDSTVKIWDAHSGACLQTLEGHSDGVRSVAFSHDSARLASASEDRTVKIWDARSGACLQTLEGHSDGVRSVAFSHDSARLASASEDRTVKIWDASSGACLQTLEGYRGLTSLVGFATQQPVHPAIGISADETWITHNTQQRLRLPLEYRPNCSAVSARCIGIGTRSGKVWIFCLT